MAYTALQLITDALTEIGVASQGHSPSAYEGQLALGKLNRLIASLTNNRLLTFTIARTTWDLVADTASYTVGVGADVNVARPVTMNMQGCNVTYIDTSADPDIELPLWPLTDDAYQAIPQKTVSATYPTNWYYNPAYTEASPYGVLTFWPVPNIGTLDGVLYAPTPIAEVTLATEIALPPGYARLYETHLAIACAPAFGAQVQPETVRAAQEAMALVESSNTRLVDLAVDAALRPVRRVSNIYTGQ